MKNTSATRSNRLAKKLRTIRLGLELSQNQILERLGLADQLFRSNISQYERGDRVPSPLVLLAYARLVNLDLAILIDDDLDLPNIIPSSKKATGGKSSSSSRRKKR